MTDTRHDIKIERDYFGKYMVSCSCGMRDKGPYDHKRAAQGAAIVHLEAVK